jgi:MFS family permease|tara:strand:+ start:3521 stop:4762 length:1242 start_codon:yes stop_codon:yes gene_type:complete
MVGISKYISTGVGVIIFCLIMAAIGRGMGDTYAIFLLPLSNDLGLARSEVASIYAIYVAAMGVFSPLSGYLFDKFGSRPIYLGGIFCLGIGYWLSGQLNTLWHFYVCMGIMSGFGAALIWQIPGQSLISRWFDKNLGTALAFIYAGFGFGILLLAPVANLLIESHGWRLTYQYFGLSFLCLLPFVAVLPWKVIEKGAPNNPRRTISGRAEGGFSLYEALKMRAYWAMFLIYFLTAFAIFGVSVQSVVYLVELGFGEFEAAGAFGIAGILSFAGMFLTGAAADRYGRSLVATISYLLTILGVIGLAFLQFVPEKSLILLWIIPYGLSMGARGPIIATLQAKLFAGRGLGAIYGMTMMGQGLGAGLSAWFGGLLFDLTGGYNLLFSISIFSSLVCIILFWITPEIRLGRLDRTKG